MLRSWTRAWCLIHMALGACSNNDAAQTPSSAASATATQGADALPAPSGSAFTAQRPSVSPVVPPATVYIERLADRVYWIAPEVLTEIAFELATGTLQPTLDDRVVVLPEIERSILTRLGLQAHDRVVTVAGQPAGEVIALHEAFRAIQASDAPFVVEIARDARLLELRYRIHPPSESALGRAKALDVLSQGIRVVDETHRVVNRDALELLAEHGDSGLAALHLPSASSILKVGPDPALGPEDIRNAFQGLVTHEHFDVHARDGTIYRIDLTNDMFSADDLETARALARPTKKRRRGWFR